MNGRGRTTRFGSIVELELPFDLAKGFEVMTFHGEGSDHQHDVAELAILTSGVCDVKVGYEVIRMRSGSQLVIPAHTPHRMIPVGGPSGHAVFMICYQRSLPSSPESSSE